MEGTSKLMADYGGFDPPAVDKSVPTGGAFLLSTYLFHYIISSSLSSQGWSAKFTYVSSCNPFLKI